MSQYCKGYSFQVPQLFKRDLKPQHSLESMVQKWKFGNDNK